jgi:hypothetical protein
MFMGAVAMALFPGEKNHFGGIRCDQGSLTPKASESEEAREEERGSFHIIVGCSILD